MPSAVSKRKAESAAQAAAAAAATAAKEAAASNKRARIGPSRSLTPPPLGGSATVAAQFDPSAYLLARFSAPPPPPPLPVPKSKSSKSKAAAAASQSAAAHAASVAAATAQMQSAEACAGCVALVMRYWGDYDVVANDVFDIVLVRSSAELNSSGTGLGLANLGAAPSFKPEYTHKLFVGNPLRYLEEEYVYGYRGLRIRCAFAVDSLFALVEIQYQQKLADADDVLRLITAHMPPGSYTFDRDTFASQIDHTHTHGTASNSSTAAAAAAGGAASASGSNGHLPSSFVPPGVLIESIELSASSAAGGAASDSRSTRRRGKEEEDTKSAAPPVLIRPPTRTTPEPVTYQIYSCKLSSTDSADQSSGGVSILNTASGGGSAAAPPPPLVTRSAAARAGTKPAAVALPSKATAAAAAAANAAAAAAEKSARALALSTARAYHQRLQIFSLLYIETADPLNLDDFEWEILLLFERRTIAVSPQPLATGGGGTPPAPPSVSSTYRFAGFTAIDMVHLPTPQLKAAPYNPTSPAAPLPPLMLDFSAGAGAPVLASASVVAAAAAKAKRLRPRLGDRVIRLNQIVILPPHQKRGHAQRLLNCVYRIGAERQCAFVDVPPPVAPAFQRIRDAMDLRRCVQSRCYYDLLAANAASEAASASGAAPSVASGGSGVAAMDTSSGSGGGGSNSSVAITVTTRAAFIPLPESGWDENEAVAVQKRLKISLSQTRMCYEVFKLLALLKSCDEVDPQSKKQRKMITGFRYEIIALRKADRAAHRERLREEREAEMANRALAAATGNLNHRTDPPPPPPPPIDDDESSSDESDNEFDDAHYPDVDADRACPVVMESFDYDDTTADAHIKRTRPFRTRVRYYKSLLQKLGLL